MATILLNPSYAIDGLTFNAIDNAGVRWMVASTTGWFDGPGVALNSTPFPRNSGSYRTTSYRAARTIVLTGWAEAPNKTTALAARDQFLGLPFGGGQMQLTVSDDGGQTRTAAVELADVPKLAPSALGLGFDWQLTLSAADPRKYDAQQTAYTKLPVAGSGLDWSTGGGLDWTGGGTGGLNWGSGAGGAFTVTNLGTADTWPVFTISGPTDTAVLTNPAIVDLATGQTLGWTGNLNQGDVVTINTSPYNRSVLLGGSADRRANLTTAQWFSIPPGASVGIQFQGTTTSSTNTPGLTVAWSSAWW